MLILKKLLEEMKTEKIHPVAYLLDAIPESDFLKYVRALTDGRGVSFEGICTCVFPRNLDEYELSIGEGFDGIEFIFFEDKISVDVPTFRKYLRMACEVYWTEHPESKAQLENYLARPQPPLEKDTLDEWKRRKAAGEYPKPYSEFEDN